MKSVILGKLLQLSGPWFLQSYNKEKRKYILLQYHDEGWVYLLVFKQLSYGVDERDIFKQWRAISPIFPAITQFLGSVQRKRTQTNTAQDFWSSRRRECRNTQRGKPTCALEIWKCSLSIHLWNTHGVKLCQAGERPTEEAGQSPAEPWLGSSWPQSQNDWASWSVFKASNNTQKVTLEIANFGCQLDTPRMRDIWLKNYLYQTVGSLWDTFLIPLGK